nr:alpha/beta hydrolase [Acidobacteriota bacterium]
HPPGKPDRLRTDHFPRLRIPALFVHGSRDPFGSTEEFRDALKLIPGSAVLVEVEGAGHDLARGNFDVTNLLVSRFRA